MKNHRGLKVQTFTPESIKKVDMNLARNVTTFQMSDEGFEYQEQPLKEEPIREVVFMTCGDVNYELAWVQQHYTDLQLYYTMQLYKAIYENEDDHDLHPENIEIIKIIHVMYDCWTKMLYKVCQYKIK